MTFADTGGNYNYLSYTVASGGSACIPIKFFASGGLEVETDGASLTDIYIFMVSFTDMPDQ